MDDDLEYSLEEESYDVLIKLMLLGDSTVGKTSILKRYSKNQFNPNYISSIGVDFETKYIKVGKKTINLQIWDTAGQERFKVIAKNYYNKSDGFIIVYDITNKKSFEDVEVWMQSVLDNLGEKESNKKRNYSLILIGNKIDLEENRVITKEEGEEICKKNNIISWGGEISIKDMSKEELEDKFIEMMKIIYKDIGNPENKNMVTKKLNEEKIKKKKRDNNLCCEKK